MTEIADGITEYAPRFPLWSDGATKRRWIRLPEGEAIDTSDMNHWSFPIGTKVWKEFSKAGKRIETRLLWKQEEGWFHMAYAWDADQTEALAVPDGERDALGTDHEIPETQDCESCHDRQPDWLLGVGAVQLDGATGISLADLVADDILTDPPSGAAPYFSVPGDATIRAALGYLHGNCGGCHHPLSDVRFQVPVELYLDTSSMATADETPVYQTAVGVSHLRSIGDSVTALIEPGDPAASAVYVRMETRGSVIEMPPFGSNQPDTAALTDIAAWINSL